MKTESDTSERAAVVLADLVADLADLAGDLSGRADLVARVARVARADLVADRADLVSRADLADLARGLARDLAGFTKDLAALVNALNPLNK